MATVQSSYGVHEYSPTIPGQVTLTYFAAALFTMTLLTDWAYVQTALVMWQDFSSWLLFAGLIAGGLATLLWLIGLAMHRRRPVWGIVILNALVLVCAFINSLMHALDGWIAVVPWGIGLSVVTVLLMLASAVLRRRALVIERRF